MNRRRVETLPAYRAPLLRWGGAGLLLAAAATLAARSLLGGKPVGPPERLTKTEVEHVYSGQSVQLRPDEDAQYVGIRAPFEDEPFFEQSRRRNAELVEGKEVRLRFDKEDRDKKGRLNPYVFLGDEFVNERLVREGLAYARLTTDTQRFAKELLAAQTEARKAKRGLWSSQSVTPEPIYPADPKYGNFHRPGCEEVNKMKPDRRVDFKSRRAAFDAGFAPCRDCDP